MFDLKASDPIDLNPDDEIEIVSDIKRGDTILFERVKPNKVLMKVILDEQYSDYTETKFRVDKSDTPGLITLKNIEG